MTTSLMIFQGVLSALLIIFVLLQFGKGAEAGLMGAADSVFTGSQKGNILTKITIILSVLFLGNSILLAKFQSQRGTKSILDSEAPIARPFSTDSPESATQNVTTTQNAAKAATPAAPKAKTPAKTPKPADKK